MNAPGSHDALARSATTRVATAVCCGGALALLTAVLASASCSGDAPRGSLAALPSAAEALSRQLELAREERPYLVLRPVAGTLTLHYGAAPLRTWTVQRVEAGPRRVRLPDRALDRTWLAARWDRPRLHPTVERPRRTIVYDSLTVPPDLTGADPWIPPTPEEAVPSPGRFVVLYDGRLGLEVVGTSATPDRGALDRAVARLGAFAWGAAGRYRVRLTMSAAEAGALYRSFPEGAPLLIAP